jgi:hypothetical protein
MYKYSFLFFLLAIFPLFKAHAHCKLDYPKGGETFISGDTISIQWSELAYHNGLNWELYYSPDGCVSWDTITDMLDYTLRQYEWVVPAGETNKGTIRLVQNNPNADYTDQSSNFSIEKSGLGIKPSTALLFGSFSIFPNPVYSLANLKFDLTKSQVISFTFYNLVGSCVGEIPPEFYFPGINSIIWNKEGLKPGIYFCRVSVDGNTRTYKFQIL